MKWHKWIICVYITHFWSYQKYRNHKIAKNVKLLNNFRKCHFYKITFFDIARKCLATSDKAPDQDIGPSGACNPNSVPVAQPPCSKSTDHFVDVLAFVRWPRRPYRLRWRLVMAGGKERWSIEVSIHMRIAQSRLTSISGFLYLIESGPEWQWFALYIAIKRHIMLYNRVYGAKSPVNPVLYANISHFNAYLCYIWAISVRLSSKQGSVRWIVSDSAVFHITSRLSSDDITAARRVVINRTLNRYRHV